jgi:hypothetical protein
MTTGGTSKKVPLDRNVALHNISQAISVSIKKRRNNLS